MYSIYLALRSLCKPNLRLHHSRHIHHENTNQNKMCDHFRCRIHSLTLHQEKQFALQCSKYWKMQEPFKIWFCWKNLIIIMNAGWACCKKNHWIHINAWRFPPCNRSTSIRNKNRQTSEQLVLAKVKLRALMAMNMLQFHLRESGYTLPYHALCMRKATTASGNRLFLLLLHRSTKKSVLWTISTNLESEKWIWKMPCFVVFHVQVKFYLELDFKFWVTRAWMNE